MFPILQVGCLYSTNLCFSQSKPFKELFMYTAEFFGGCYIFIISKAGKKLGKSTLVWRRLISIKTLKSERS